jgi:CheY-like chemotaxis protein
MTDAKTYQRICALMQRVLIVDPKPPAAKMLSELLRDAGHCQIWTATDLPSAMGAAERIDPHLVFVDQSAGFDGAAFTRQLRRSNFGCRKAPVIMISVEATAATILAARDAGVHEFLRKPFTIRDLTRRLEAVAVRPRDWVEGMNYVGPDRRRFNSGDYAGALKRRVDHAVTPDEARLLQALRILKTAIAALDDDPRQALRAMADDLTRVAKNLADAELETIAQALGRKVYGLDPRLARRDEIAPLVAPLLARLPGDEPQRRPAA